MVGGGYISAIGRDGQLPLVVAALRDSVDAQGRKMTMEPMYDRNNQYTHCKVTAWSAADATFQTIDGTGAASRFPPWELFDGGAQALKRAQGQFSAASDLDAPPESGHFDRRLRVVRDPGCQLCS
jgi:hypothetical protein